MYYVYILKSKKDGNLYIGQTSNLSQRLECHNSGRIKSTKRRAPFQLIHVEEFQTRGEAMKREKALKDIKLEFVRLFEGFSDVRNKNFYLSYDLRRRCNSTSKN